MIDMQLPHGIEMWGPFVTASIAGITKLIRGSVMWRRAHRIDRMGWSIVSFDLILGSALLTVPLYMLLPGLHVFWLNRAIWALVSGVSLFQLATVYASGHYRIQRVMSPLSTTPVDSEERAIAKEERTERRDVEDRQEEAQDQRQREIESAADEHAFNQWEDRRKDQRRASDKQQAYELSAYRERYGDFAQT